MAKLYFRYGTVGSAKTLNLLAVAHAYDQQQKKVYLIKPRIDTRFGVEVVGSRAGLTREANLLVDDTSCLDLQPLENSQCILVDEAQFLAPKLVDQLRIVTKTLNIPVICYGLRTDFRTRLFPGSKRLMELADAIEEIKTTCVSCNKKAVFNLKIVNGQATRRGPIFDLGFEEKYLPACCDCYYRQVEVNEDDDTLG